MDKEDLITWGKITTPIIGADREERDCPNCHGSGRISGYELILGFCPAEMTIREGETLSCIVKGFHEPPHQTIMQKPCMECGGMDAHTEWCETGGPEEETIVVLFNDDGEYWVKPGWVE